MENWFIVIRQGNTPNQKYETVDEAQQDGAVTENVGRFLQNMINFVLVAISLFVILLTIKRVSDYRKRRREEKGGADATKPHPEDAHGGNQTCPWCGSNIPVKAVKCMYCTSFVHEKVPSDLLTKQAAAAALIELEG